MTNSAGMTCIKEYGVCDEHTDSLGMAYFDGKIQAIGGAIQAVTPSNLHQVYNPTTGERLYKYAAPFTADSEMICSQILPNKLVVIGSLFQTQIWQFDPTVAGYTSSSWTQITSNYVPAIGLRSTAWGADLNGWFYIGGGWTGTDVYKTQNFTSWTLVGSLPAAISRISGCACFVHGGLIHVIGGATRLASPYGVTEFYAAENLGHHYTFDGTTWTLVETDATKFGQIWCDGASDGTNCWLSAGYGVNPYGNKSNLRKLYKSTNGGTTWTEITTRNDGLAWFTESHRRGAVSTSGAAYFLGGNFVNDLWKMA